MPPRKRNAAAASAAGSTSKIRQSKLAKENNLTGEQENEIKEAWRLFALKHVEGYEDEKEGVIRKEDVRRCLIALNIPPNSSVDLADILSTLFPSSDSTYTTYPPFLSVCALLIHQKGSSPSATASEVHEAYALFTGNGSTSTPITISHLRRIARDLKEDVSDELLRGMILEANGGAGVSRGVGLEDFEAVMRRAGVF